MQRSLSSTQPDILYEEMNKTYSGNRPAWTEICCPNTGKRNVHASVIYKHYIITFGGGDGRVALSDLIVFDMNTYTWQKVEPLGPRPAPRFGHSMCLYKSNMLIVFGGNNQSAMNEVGILTIKSTQPFVIEWKVVKSINDGELHRYWHTAHIFEDYMYMFGGTNEDKDASDQLWRLNLNEFNWELCEASGEIPQKRSGHGSVLFNGVFYVLGGYANSICLSDIYSIDITIPEMLVWKKIKAEGLSPGPRASMCLQERDGKIYLFGGQIVGEYYNDLFEFDIETSLWRQIETKNKAPCERSCYSAVMYDGSLIIWGGFKGSCVSDIFSIPLGQQNILENTGKASRKSNYFQHMRELLLDKIHSDVCFEVKGKRFDAHKNILSARCHYFRNMFDSKMKETQEATIVIPDVSQETFSAFLEFTYCDEVNLSEDLALELLTVSNKWLFTDLEDECELFLSNILTIENFVKVGHVAEKFETSTLLSSLLKFGARHFEVLETKGMLLEMSKSVLVGIMKEIKNMDIK